jgi:hypothetical protein
MIKRFFNWVTGRGEIDRLRQRLACLQIEIDRARWDEEHAKQHAIEAERGYEELRAQVMQIRVSQSTVKRAGWEVMCFVPEEVLEHCHTTYNILGGSDWRYLVKRVAMELADLALKGIHRVRSNGKCCALVFQPLNINGPAKAPEFVQALWDNDGKFKLSEKCWDTRTEEQRVRRAAGCGGFGV